MSTRPSWAATAAGARVRPRSLLRKSSPSRPVSTIDAIGSADRILGHSVGASRHRVGQRVVAALEVVPGDERLEVLEERVPVVDALLAEELVAERRQER